MASATASNEMGPEMAMVYHKALDEWKAANPTKPMPMRLNETSTITGTLSTTTATWTATKRHLPDLSDDDDDSPEPIKGSKKKVAKKNGDASNVETVAKKCKSPVNGMHVFAMKVKEAIAKEGWVGRDLLAEVTFRWGFFTEKQQGLYKVLAGIVNMHHEEHRKEVEKDQDEDAVNKMLNKLWVNLSKKAKNAYVTKYEAKHGVVVLKAPEMVARFEGPKCPKEYLGVALDAKYVQKGDNTGHSYTEMGRADERYVRKLEAATKADAAAEKVEAANALDGEDDLAEKDDVEKGDGEKGGEKDDAEYDVEKGDEGRNAFHPSMSTSMSTSASSLKRPVPDLSEDMVPEDQHWLNGPYDQGHDYHKTADLQRDRQVTTDDVIRDKVTNGLVDAFLQREGHTIHIEIFEERVRTAQSIVQRLYTRHQHVTSEYKKQLRAIKSNLKDTKNPDFIKRVTSGELSPADVATMPTERMASDALVHERRNMRHYAKWNVAISDQRSNEAVPKDLGIYRGGTYIPREHL